MTVSYQYEVASSTSGGFMRLLVRWRGSVWKLVYREILVFVVLYCLLTCLYRYVLSAGYKKVFERIVFFCSSFLDVIPLSFVLGFYVSFTASRWWSQYRAIPWPDKLMNCIALYVRGSRTEDRRVVRRTLMRYLNLTLVLVLRSISMAVKRRFPTKDHLVEAGFITKEELEMLQSVPSTEFNTFWIPCTWFVNLLREHADRIDPCGLKLIMEEFNIFRADCGLLWSYDWISVPLVYTQVVTLATYAFYVASIFGRQHVDVDFGPRHKYEYFIPWFTVLQLFFYMGLLKVAEQLINPFGDDDEDFELNWMIDRHIKVSYLGVDSLRGLPPPLVKDSYFDMSDMKLPYTEASRGYKRKTYRGSVAKMQVPEDKQMLILPNILEESEDESEVAAQYHLKSRQASLWTLVAGKINDKFSSMGSRINSAGLNPNGSGHSEGRLKARTPVRSPSQVSAMRGFFSDLKSKMMPGHRQRHLERQRKKRQAMDDPEMGISEDEKISTYSGYDEDQEEDADSENLERWQWLRQSNSQHSLANRLSLTEEGSLFGNQEDEENDSIPEFITPAVGESEPIDMPIGRSASYPHSVVIDIETPTTTPEGSRHSSPAESVQSRCQTRTN